MFPLAPPMKPLAEARVTGLAVGLASFLILPLVIDQHVTLPR